MIKATVTFTLIAKDTATVKDVEAWITDISKVVAKLPKDYSSYSKKQSVALGFLDDNFHFITTTEY